MPDNDTEDGWRTRYNNTALGVYKPICAYYFPGPLGNVLMSISRYFNKKLRIPLIIFIRLFVVFMHSKGNPITNDL